MRLYSFQNFYLAGIHAGIQTAHTVARMSQKYSMDEGFVNLAPDNELQAGNLFSQWARRGGGETIIIKNGGMQVNLQETLALFNSTAHNYPFDFFHESQEALGGAMTNVSIVVPTHIWQLADGIRNSRENLLYHARSGNIYAVYNKVLEEYVVMDLNPHNNSEFCNVSRADNFSSAERSGKQPPLFPNDELITINAFDLKLIKQMNKCGLM